MASQTRFAVMGLGNVGHALAADLALRGHPVAVADLPAFADRVAAVRERGGIELEGAAGSGHAEPALVTDEPAAAAEGAGVIFIASPAYGHEVWCEALAPHLAEGQFVVFISCFGAWRARRWLEPVGAIPVETATSPFAVRSPAPARVVITGVKARVPVAALPASETASFLDRVGAALPQMVAASSVLETSLENRNPVVHVPMILFNVGRIESDDPARWTLYGDGATESVVKVMLAIDAERRAVARRAGLDSRPLTEAFAAYYPGFDGDGAGDGDRDGDGDGASAISRALRTSAPHANPILGSTASLDDRYVTEDVPFGLAPWAALGRQWGVETPTLDSIIQLYGILSAGTAVSPPLTAATLGVAGLSPRDLIAAVS